MVAGPTTWQASTLVNQAGDRDYVIDELVSAIDLAKFPADAAADATNTDAALKASGLMKAA